MSSSGRKHGAARFDGLHVLVDDDPRWKFTPIEQAQAACRGGAAVIQLRAKHATDEESVALGLEIRSQTRRADVQFIFNDRFDLALACGADGVHLGQTDVPPDAIPVRLRQRLCIGRSSHTAEQARIALQEGVDYVAFGPVFETHSKSSDYASRGLALLAEIAALVGPCPLVAIGGITRDNLEGVISAGATGAAVISAAAGATNPEDAVRGLARAFRAERP